MKNTLLLCCLILFILVSCTKKPAIQVNIDGLKNTADSIRSFTIANLGTDSLVIEDFTSSCECTALNLKASEKIAPNDSLKVLVRIKKDDKEVGKIIYVTLKTNAKPRITSFNFKT